MQLILKYFPEISPVQKEQFEKLGVLYKIWNERINVISRKDIVSLYERHVLHSLAIAKFIKFIPGTMVLDVGTGGGFPGIPLAIIFPHVRFHLIDSIGKKITVVNEVISSTGLQNVETAKIRVEDVVEKYDFIISRAVSAFPDFVKMTERKVSEFSKNSLANGIINLKGGDLSNEIASFSGKVLLVEINQFFTEPFFETKKIVYLPIK
jgi:16S rRNA (guanine527-N7)-methyltransferase